MSRSAATSGVTSPAPTNVRVMSAQQPLASSRGQTSISIGRRAGSGPEPGSWPPPANSDTTMMSGGARGGALRADRVAHDLGGERPAVVLEQAVGGGGGADQRLAGGHAALGGALGAADALQLGGRLDAPAGVHGLAVDVDPDAGVAQLVG